MKGRTGMTGLTAARLLGAALLTAGGAFFGWSRVAARKRRLALLRALSAGLGQMEEELRALQTPLPDLFARLGDRPFFSLLHLGFGSGSVEALWRRAALALELSDEEREALCAPAPFVGRYDAARQAGALALCRSRLDALADRLEAELNGSARSFCGLGAALGAMLAVLLL